MTAAEPQLRPPGRLADRLRQPSYTTSRDTNPICNQKPEIAVVRSYRYRALLPLNWTDRLAPLRHIQIFLSSPGDVADERDITRELIKSLRLSV